MIGKMDKRVAGVVALLGLAWASVSRPAFAQDGNSWFDDGANGEPPAPPPGTQPPMPNAPPRPQVSYGAPSTPAPYGAPSTPAPYGAPSTPAPYGAPSAPAPYGAPSTPGPQAPASEDEVPETDPRAITEFRSTLDPYGTWVEDEKYGTVWVPNRDAVGEDFAPYVSAGHWALTDDNDWLWQSDYPFGGVVFHYGRWVWVPGTGWAWVAGRRYANAWVTWRVSTDDYGYIGWAPMPPAWGWYGGSAVSLWWYPPTAYVFCPNQYAFSYRVHSYIVRDRYVIHDVAAHTRNYSDGGAQRLAAQPRVLPANSPAPRGPTLQSARIPASAAPSSRVPLRSAYAGPRSTSFTAVGHSVDSGRFSSAGARPIVPSAYQAGTSYRTPYANPSSSARPRPSSLVPVNNGYRAAPISAPQGYSSPSAAASRNSAPSSPSYRAPSTYRAPPSFHSSTSYHTAPSFNSSSSSSFHSSPSFHSAPSGGGGRTFSSGRR